VNVKPRGTLVIIGGREEKSTTAEQPILKEVAAHARGEKHRLVVITVASEEPKAVAAEYTSVFHHLGVRHVDVLDIRSRDEAFLDESVARIREASDVFFTGGDQLRITSQLSDSPTFQMLFHRYQQA
jgi:cyanophycinase